jgi:hypothetical protein
MPNENHDPHNGEFASGSHTGSKSEIARSAAVRCGRDVQTIAEETEATMAKALGADRTPDNSPFDLTKGKNAIEIKTLVSNKASKITMSSDAMARKAAFIKENKASAHTLVVDKRGDPTKYFYAPKIGSLRISSMQSISLGALKVKFK